MISYEKLVRRLKENGFSQYKLKQDRILGSATITKIFKNDGLNGESIDMKVLDKMCKLLNCQQRNRKEHSKMCSFFFYILNIVTFCIIHIP